MKNIYLKFYENKQRILSEEELGHVDDLTYLKYLEDGNYQLKNSVFIGRVDKKNNFAFLLQEPEDIFLNPDVAASLMHDDIILIKEKRGRYQVELILEQGLKYFIAEVKRTKKGRFRYYTDKPLYKSVLVGDESKIVTGSIVRLKVDRIINDHLYASIDSIVGHKTDPNIDILKIVAEHNWPDTDFDYLEEVANSLNINISEEKKGRKDLTNDLIVTIDGADAKDLDDAVSLTYKDGLYHLGVHIADVSLYVTHGSEIDKSAYKKATSVYLANSVIPMLPRKLANDLCSLNPNTDKLTLSALMTFDESGKLVNYEIAKSIINSKYRLTYDGVNDLLETGKTLGSKELDEMIVKMNELSLILTNLRNKRGALNFSSEELKFELKGEEVIGVEKRIQGLGEKLIESFMLAANEAVAFHMEKSEIPALYRVHEKPESAKLELALKSLTNLGIKTNNNFSPKNLQRILENIETSPLSSIVNMFILRAMQKARYDYNPLGHFGLGARYYAHFTSPIRRYPDLILHRIIREIVLGENNSVQTYQYYERNLEEIGMHTSKMERTAIDIERAVNSLMAAKFMSNHLGEEFSGQIIQVLKTGFFVQLKNGIEGFVNVKSQYFKYEYNELLLHFKIAGKTFKIGDDIKVRVTSVDLLEKEIDFEIVGD